MTTRLAILRALEASEPMLSPVAALAVDVKAMVPKRPEYSEVKGELDKLEMGGMVVSVRHPESGLKYRITSAGMAELRILEG